MRHVALAALVVCAALLGVVWWQSVGLASLEADNAQLARSLHALRAEAEHSRLARQVERARAERLTVRAAETSTAIKNINEEGIADAALDPRLADIVNRLQRKAR